MRRREAEPGCWVGYEHQVGAAAATPVGSPYCSSCTRLTRALLTTMGNPCCGCERLTRALLTQVFSQLEPAFAATAGVGEVGLVVSESAC